MQQLEIPVESIEDDQSHKKSILDEIMEKTSLYKSGMEFQSLLDFVVRLRNFAPFNAMLLNLQKPGLMYAATKGDWQTRFQRSVKDDARPLLILWPFGPVALVYDVEDTEGKELPAAVKPFRATGKISQEFLTNCYKRVRAKNIVVVEIDAGSGSAGYIQAHSSQEEHHLPQRTALSDNPKKSHNYSIKVNRNHAVPVRFATLAHELAHLFLGHLGKDKALDIPGRAGLSHAQRELEAESVAYLVCNRVDIKPNSDQYLSNFFTGNSPSAPADIHEIMKASSKVEELLCLTQLQAEAKPSEVTLSQLVDKRLEEPVFVNPELEFTTLYVEGELPVKATPLKLNVPNFSLGLLMGLVIFYLIQVVF
jgi:hypothetical protein